MIYRGGCWRSVQRWRAKASSGAGAFRTPDGIWIVTSADLARRVLLDDTGAYPHQPAFLRVNGKPLPPAVRAEVTANLLKLFAPSSWHIDPEVIAREVARPVCGRFQAWGPWLIYGLLRHLIVGPDRPRRLQVLVDRYIRLLAIEWAIRGNRLVVRRPVAAYLKRALAREFWAMRSSAGTVRDLVALTAGVTPALDPDACAELYLRLVTAVTVATGTAVETTTALEWRVAARRGGPAPDAARSALEAQRLYPTSWRLNRRASRDDEIGDLVARRGDHIVIASAVIHRDPRHWPEPDVYRPERWHDRRRIATPAYLPFSTGQAMCPGSGIALALIEGVTDTLLRSFDAVTHIPHDVTPHALSVLAMPRGRLQLVRRLEPR